MNLYEELCELTVQRMALDARIAEIEKEVLAEAEEGQRIGGGAGRLVEARRPTYRTSWNSERQERLKERLSPSAWAALQEALLVTERKWTKGQIEKAVAPDAENNLSEHRLELEAALAAVDAEFREQHAQEAELTLRVTVPDEAVAAATDSLRREPVDRRVRLIEEALGGERQVESSITEHLPE